MSETARLQRNLTIEAVRVTEAAAVAAAELMGRGDEKAADQAAVDAMRQALNQLDIAGTTGRDHQVGGGQRIYPQVARPAQGDHQAICVQLINLK